MQQAAAPMAGRRRPRRAALLAALATLLFLACCVFFFLLSTTTTSSSPSSPASRLAAVRRHAEDHAAVLAAYAAHARRLSSESSSQTSSFLSASSQLSSLATRVTSSTVSVLEKETRAQLKRAKSLATAGAKEAFDTQSKVAKLSDTVFAVSQQLLRARKAGLASSRIAAGSTPKSLHCLAMRLLQSQLSSNPNNASSSSAIVSDDESPVTEEGPELTDPALYHYAIFSDNVLAVSVVVASAARAAAEPARHVFHVVTAPMYLQAFRAWFARSPAPLGSRVQLLAASELSFPFLSNSNGSSSPLLRQIEEGNRELALRRLDYLRFYLPEMFPALAKVVLLEDDVVVQRDLAGLWRLDMGGMANAALHTCFGGFRRYAKYLNFSEPVIRERFSPRACAWSYGVNVFDLHAWRRDNCTRTFHDLMDMNENGTLWDPASVLAAGLVTFDGNTRPLERSWHVMGLGCNPHVRPEDIRGAAVVHFNGDMKPWLDVAFNQYKRLWTKHVDADMELLTLCNFGL